MLHVLQWVNSTFFDFSNHLKKPHAIVKNGIFVMQIRSYMNYINSCTFQVYLSYYSEGQTMEICTRHAQLGLFEGAVLGFDIAIESDMVNRASLSCCWVHFVYGHVGKHLKYGPTCR